MNPGSGHHAGEDPREQISGVLQQAGRRFEIILIENSEVVPACQEAARRAASEGGAIVGVGGDGTINSAAQAALTHDCPLGVIAQGTFNLFARDLGLSQDARKAAEILLLAQPKPVRVGLVNGRVFLVNASLGMYPQLLEDRETAKQKLGRHRWVAFLAGLLTVFSWARHLRLEMELDGELRRLRTPSIFVGNNRLQLDRVLLSDEMLHRLDEGHLVALCAKPLGFFGKLKAIWHALWGKLDESGAVDNFAFKSMTVLTPGRRRLKIAADGEGLIMQTPVRFSVSPRPLKVLMPDAALLEPRE